VQQLPQPEDGGNGPRRIPSVTTKSRAKQGDEPDIQTVEEPAAEPLPLCGKPHHLPQLALTITCAKPAEELEPGEPEHEHRHEDGDAVYVWR
jgi:hypothetical protein